MISPALYDCKATLGFHYSLRFCRSRVLGFIGFIGWFKMVYLTGLAGLQGFSGVGVKSRAGTVVAVAGLAVTRSRMSIQRTYGNLGPSA